MNSNAESVFLSCCDSFTFKVPETLRGEYEGDEDGKFSLVAMELRLIPDVQLLCVNLFPGIELLE